MTANVGGFDPSKSSILMLHPMLMDSSWLANQLDDPRLDDCYNLIAFDLRACGKSKCGPSDAHDSWVNAADLAFAHQALHLPACHIFAVETLSVTCALRFAILFPDLCLSLTLCNVPPPTDLGWVYNSYEELLLLWSFAEDLESFELAGTEAATLVLGNNYDPEILDQLMEFWALHTRPALRLRTVEMFNVFMNRTPLNKEELAQIRHPVLIIQSEQSPVAPVKYAEELAAELHDAHLFIVKGVSGPSTVLPSSASIVNRVFSQFLAHMPPSNSTITAPTIPVALRMKSALTKLGSLAGNTAIAARDPRLSSSFSRISEEVRENQAECLTVYEQDLDKAFSPLNYNGKPYRRYIDRHKDHWFHPDRDGMSFISGEFLSFP
ncbi:alpha/beta-hydrolase [Athelia psychrophila]|uniref:Alpha/beta-hydrolase n=1 Tax=Athelia psychrophila TaxID=1759441 RepID=A0A166BWW9_9AGAM|nr:alpha/beta-hydrolase [Fibularhizoctonia sp. CBS 109695]